MARLPTFEDLGGRPTPRSGGVVKVPMPESPEVAIAGELAQVSDTMTKIKEYDDKVQAEDAQNKLQQRTIELRNGDNGFKRLQSGDVATRPVYKEYNERFEDAVNEISDGLSNDYQRKLFRSRANVVKTQYGNDLVNHIQKEKEIYFKQTVESGKAIELQNAGEHWNEPGSVKLSIARTGHLIDLQAEREGWPFATKKAAKLAAASDIHSAVIDQAVANENPTYAKGYFEKNKKNIDATTHDDITKLIRNSELRVLSQSVADEIMSQDMEQSDALQKVRKAYKGDEEKAIVDAINQRYDEAKEAKRQTELSATDQAWQYYNDARDAGNPDPYGAIPLTILDEMNQKSRAVLKSQSEGKTAKSGSGDYYEIRQMMRDDPKTFREVDLREYQLSPGDFKELVKAQTEDVQIEMFNSATDIVNKGLLAIDIEPKQLIKTGSKGDRARAFHNRINDEIRLFQLDSGKSPTKADIQEIVDRQTIQVLRERDYWFDTDIPVAEIEIEGVPSEMADELAKALQDAGRPVTETNIKKLYDATQR